MAKHKKFKQNVAVTKAELGLPAYFQQHPNLLPLSILVILLLIFFHALILSGKTFLPPDTLTSRSIVPFINQAFKDGIYPLWNPYIFSGMPSFASLASAPFIDLLNDLFNGLIWVVKLILPLPNFTLIFLNYILFGLFVYVLLVQKTRIRSIALFAAVAMVFQPGVVAFAAFGHNTKLLTALFIPMIFLLVEELLEKRRVFYFALLALAVGIQMLRAHTQMSYYTFMMIGLFTVYWLVEAVIQKHALTSILKSLGLLLLALGIGAAMSSWLYLSVQEYSHYSIRGGAAGLEYGYATNWSFSPKEVLTFFVPSFVGFGGQTYWGNMPFTDYPLYMGIIPLFFAGLAFVLRRDRIVWFLGLLGALALLVSFGNEFKYSPVYNLLFKYLPYFNKFRVPSMILILTQFSVVVLASLALHSLWQLREKVTNEVIKKIKRYLYVFGGITGLIFLYIFIAKTSLLSMMRNSEKVMDPSLQAQSYKLAVTDSVVMIAFLATAAIFLFLYLNRKIKVNSFLFAIVIFTIFDLWLVDFKIIDPKPKANEQAFFRADEVVKFCQADKSLFRIMPVFDNHPDNWYAYHFIQNVYGYHAAKLKNYQTMLEETGLPRDFLLKYYKPVIQDGRQVMTYRSHGELDPVQLRLHENVLRMLNVKYIVTPYLFDDSCYQLVVNGEKKVFQHLTVLPRAFFVDHVTQVADQKAVFVCMKQADYDPAQEALIYEKPPVSVTGANGNSVSVTKWDIHHIELRAKAERPGFLVLSEIYYPAGWQAKLDGTPIKIFQTNDLLRGVLVPPGEHQIVFDFQPQRFRMGFFITTFLFLGCIALAAVGFRRFHKKD